jgi:hypothetical protein
MLLIYLSAFLLTQKKIFFFLNQWLEDNYTYIRWNQNFKDVSCVKTLLQLTEYFKDDQARMWK